MWKGCGTLVNEKQQEPEEKLKHIPKIQEAIEPLINDPAIKKAGYDTLEIVDWLWYKATDQKFDPQYHTITSAHVKKFKRRTDNFILDVKEGQDWIATQMKLPRTILEKLPETDVAYHEIVNADSYRKEFLMTNITHVEDILGATTRLIKDKWNLKDYGNFRKKERELEKAVKNQRENPLDAKNVNVIIEDLFRTIDQAEISSEGAGTLMHLRDIMEGRVEAQTNDEHTIVNNWHGVRRNGAATTMSAISKIRSTIKYMFLEGSHDRRQYENILNDLEDAHKRILFQSEVDKKSKQYFTKKEMALMREQGLDAETLKVLDKSGNEVQLNGYAEYLPRYNLTFKHNLMSFMDVLTDQAMPEHMRKFSDLKDMTEVRNYILQDIHKVAALSNRAKGRGENVADYYSRDPFYYLNRYVHDISYFNYHANVQHTYIKASTKLLNAYITGDLSVESAVARAAHDMVGFLTDIKDGALGEGRGGLSHMDSTVRLLTGFQFFRTMGYSIKTPLKNRTQTWQDWVIMGTVGRRQAREWLGKTDPLTDQVNESLAKESMKRFSMLFGTKGSASLAAATGGSISDSWLPKEFILDEKGNFKYKEVTALDKAEEKMSRLTAHSAKFQQWAENQNRVGTFKRVFALTYMQMSQGQSQGYYVKEWQKKNNTQERPSQEQLGYYIAHLAGNVSANAVYDIHFNYDNYAKAKILQSKKGQVVGQFQHFRFGFWNLHYDIYRDAINTIRDGEIFAKKGTTQYNRLFKNETGLAPELQRAVRAGMMTVIPNVIGAYTGLGFVNMFENDVVDFVKGQHEYWTADITTAEGRYARERYNPLAEVTGPTINWFKKIGQLFHFWHLDDMGFITFNDSYAKTFNNLSDEFYQKLRLLTLQGSRTAYHSLPGIMSGTVGGVAKALQVEAGLVHHSDLSKTNPWHNSILGKIYNSTDALPNISSTRGYSKKKRKRKSYKITPMESLDLLEGGGLI